MSSTLHDLGQRFKVVPTAVGTNCPGICSAKRHVASKNPCEGFKPSQGSEAAPRRRCAQGTTPCVLDTTNHYKEERLIEEVWRTIKEALKLEMTESNYRTCIADTQALAFNRDTGTLLVEAPSPLVANQLNNYFQMTMRRAVAGIGVSLQGVPIAMVEFVSRRRQLWEAGEDPHLEE